MLKAPSTWVPMALALVCRAAAFTPTLFFNISLPDVFPMFSYSQNWVNLPEYFQREAPDDVYGTSVSYHALGGTMGPSDVVKLNFVGTFIRLRIALRGGSQASFTVLVDDNQHLNSTFAAGSTAPVAGPDNLEWGNHSAVLTGVATDLSFGGAIVTTGMQTTR